MVRRGGGGGNFLATLDAAAGLLLLLHCPAFPLKEISIYLAHVYYCVLDGTKFSHSWPVTHLLGVLHNGRRTTQHISRRSNPNELYCPVGMDYAYEGRFSKGKKARDAPRRLFLLDLFFSATSHQTMKNCKSDFLPTPFFLVRTCPPFPICSRSFFFPRLLCIWRYLPLISPAAHSLD